MNDVFRFLALAAALGVAAGMVLGAVALLLAAPAHAVEPRPGGVDYECLPVLRTPGPPPRIEI
jgi:hypothetical protein